MGQQLTRREDWPERLHDAFSKIAQRPFAWGTSDCLLTAADAIQAMTGSDPAVAHRGTYSSQAGALRIVAASGCSSLEAFIAQLATAHGYLEIRPKFAQRGDLVLFDAQQGTACGIVHLNGREAVCAGESGLVRLPVSTARRAWRI